MGRDEHPDVRRVACADEADDTEQCSADRGNQDAVAIEQASHRDAAERKAEHRGGIRHRGFIAQDAEVRLHRRQYDDIGPHADAADGAEHQGNEQAHPGVRGVDPRQIGAGRVCDADHKTRVLKSGDVGSIPAKFRKCDIAYW
jgi:hypothetical protein